jgi:hypothetical protein
MGDAGPLPQLTDVLDRPESVLDPRYHDDPYLSTAPLVPEQVAGYLAKYVQLLPERQGASRIILIDTGHGQPRSADQAQRPIAGRGFPRGAQSSQAGAGR